MSDLLESPLLEQNCLLLRNDQGTRLTKSMKIGSVTYLIVTTPKPSIVKGLATTEGNRVGWRWSRR